MNYKLLLLVAFSIFLISVLILDSAKAEREDFVYVVEVEGEINAGTSNFIEKSIDRAERDNAALIIKLDTPGGLLSATEDIVKRMLRSDVTIAVWVTPRGAWAASAGTYILLASTENAAAMDNGTRIGATQPVPPDPKLTSWAAGWIEGIAKERGRPPEIARKFVEQNLTMDPDNALQNNVIELIASDIDEILIHLGLSGAEPKEIEMGLMSKFLAFVSNSQVMMILFILGIFGLITEISTPGIGLPGIAGAVCLLLSFWGMGVIRIDYIAMALLGLGVILLAYELFTPGFGIFGGGGVVALVLGLAMVDKEPWIEVAGNVVKGIVLGTVAVLAVLLVLVRRTLRKPPTIGEGELIGKIGVVTADLAPEGLVKLRGELWTAVCKGRIKKGEKIVVKGMKGIKLVVEKYRGKK